METLTREERRGGYWWPVTGGNQEAWELNDYTSRKERRVWDLGIGTGIDGGIDGGESIKERHWQGEGRCEKEREGEVRQQ